MTQSLTVLATGDVDEKVLQSLLSDLQPEITLAIDERRVVLKSAEPPSWISLIAAADWWIQVLGAYAALYIAEIVKEAGKETWRNRAKALVPFRASSDLIKKLAHGISAALERMKPAAHAVVAIPFPDEIYTTSLQLSSQEEADIAVDLSIFVHHMPQLAALLTEGGLKQTQVVGWVHLRILDDGSLEVSWMDRTSLDNVKVVIPIRNAP
jgi:hypothetical protein